MSITPLAFLLVFFVGILSALLIDASFGIYLYVVNYFINPPGRWWWWQIPDLRFALTIGITTTAAYLLRSSKYAGNKFFDAPQTKWLIFFYAIMIVTWPVAASAALHKEYLILVLKYVIFYFLIVKTIDTRQKFERLIGIFILGQFYIGWIVYEVGRTSSQGRVEGMGTSDADDSNGLAALMVVSVPFLIHYLIAGKKWQKFCSLLMLVFILNALILINSRISLIALIVSVIYYLLLSLKSPSFSRVKSSIFGAGTTFPKINKLKIIIGVAVVVASFLYLADTLFWDRMITIIEPEAGTTDSGRSRFFYWERTFAMLGDHPFGAGARGYQILSPQYLPPEALSQTFGSREAGTRAVHSTYFEVLAEYGYHGLLVFMLFVFSNIRYLKKIKKILVQKKFYEPYFMNIALETGFLAFLVAGLTQDRLYAEVLYWLPAFIAAYGNICFKEIQLLEKGRTQVSNS